MDDKRKWIAYCINCHKQLYEKSHSRDMLELAASFHRVETAHSIEIAHTIIIGYKIPIREV